MRWQFFINGILEAVCGTARRVVGEIAEAEDTVQHPLEKRLRSCNLNLIIGPITQAVDGTNISRCFTFSSIAAHEYNRGPYCLSCHSGIRS